MKKISDAKVFDEIWCDWECPHLKLNGGCEFSCSQLGTLDYYDGPLAKCKCEEKEIHEDEKTN